MNQKQIELISTYCGMTEARAEAFIEGSQGKRLAPATMTSLVECSLVAPTKDHLTGDGAALMLKIVSVLEGRFVPESPTLPTEELALIEPTARFARMETVKSASLRSSHLKALKRVAKIPGVASENHARVFGSNELEDLVKRGYLRQEHFTKCWRFRPLTLTNKGKRILEWCVEAA